MLGKQLKCPYCGNTKFSQPIEGYQSMEAYLQPDGSIEYPIVETIIEDVDKVISCECGWELNIGNIQTFISSFAKEEK